VVPGLPLPRPRPGPPPRANQAFLTVARYGRSVLGGARDRMFKWGKKGTMTHQATKQRPLSSVLREVPGRWVAVDRLSGEPVAVADTPYALAKELRSRQLKNVAVVRAPDPNDTELVGLG